MRRNGAESLILWNTEIQDADLSWVYQREATGYLHKCDPSPKQGGFLTKPLK